MVTITKLVWLYQTTFRRNNESNYKRRKIDSINELKEPDVQPTIQEIQEIQEPQHKEEQDDNPRSDFEEYEKYKVKEENVIEEDYHDLPDLIFVDNEEYDSYPYYASDDEEDDYYRH